MSSLEKYIGMRHKDIVGLRTFKAQRRAAKTKIEELGEGRFHWSQTVHCTANQVEVKADLYS